MYYLSDQVRNVHDPSGINVTWSVGKNTDCPVGLSLRSRAAIFVFDYHGAFAGQFTVGGWIRDGFLREAQIRNEVEEEDEEQYG